jgi:hypothetical protein
MQQSLQTKHEELLALDEDKHPPYINSNYLKAYKALFKSHGFCCRFKSCPASDTGFPSIKARASHETEHFPTYRCKECDFFVRGFRSKGDLVNHVDKYHANTESIELPAELLPSSPQPGQAPPTQTLEIRSFVRAPSPPVWPPSPPPFRPPSPVWPPDPQYWLPPPFRLPSPVRPSPSDAYTIEKGSSGEER